MRIKNLDLVVVIGIVVLNIVWTYIPNHPVSIGILLVLPLTLVLPGYTLTEILLRGRSLYRARAAASERSQPATSQPVGMTDQIVLSLGLSLALDILVGFGLNFLPIGLQASSWALALGLLTIIFTLLTALLRQRDSERIARVSGVRITASNGLLLGLAVIVIGASVWLAMARPLNPQPSFTQLWMLPAQNNSCSVSIGVQSFETTSLTYRVVLKINNTHTNNWSSITLSPQQKWSRSVSVTPGNTSSLNIQAQLYRADKPDTIYRSAHITFHVATIMKAGQIQNQCKL
jgi:Predicted membrane protein